MVLDDVPAVDYLSEGKGNELVFKVVGFYCDLSVSVLHEPLHRPLRSWIHPAVVNKSPSRSLHHVNRSLGVHVVFLIVILLLRFPLVHWPGPLVAVLVSVLHDVDFVLSNQFLQVFSQVCDRGVFPGVR